MDLANIREQLETIGFSFHTEPPAEKLHATHWFCWCGPKGEWDVECGDEHSTEPEAIAEAAMHYATYLREEVIDPVIAATRTTSPNSGCADAIMEIAEVLQEQLGIEFDENEEACAHEWVHTGTAYGGDDERYHGEGRAYCSKCGADGDA